SGMWKKTLALLFSFLILGLAFSGASATASLVNSTVNGTVTVPQEFSPEKRPGDEVQPQVVPGIVLVIGAILVDNALSLAIEHYVSPEAAMAYDALSTILAPDPTDIVRGGKWGIKVLAKDGGRISRFSMGIVKEYFGRKVMVREFSRISSENAQWVVGKLGREYLDEIGEKYVKKRGLDFDEAAGTLKELKEEKMITNINAIRLIVEKGWDVRKLEKVLEDVKSVRGGDDLIRRINADLGNERARTLGPLYEAEVVSHLKRSGWKVEEVEKDVVKSLGNTEIDIIAKKGLETVLIECKRSFGGVKPSQILAQAEYAKSKNIRKIYVYYSRDAYNPRVMSAIREAESKYGVDIELVQLSSEFN
ncbi:MAG: hypothetical protein PWQ79_2217, partial [Thermococcaceae archaeon]|nr:hypothetical protein [Thermococcaceae archaeon]